MMSLIFRIIIPNSRFHYLFSFTIAEKCQVANGVKALREIFLKNYVKTTLGIIIK